MGPESERQVAFVPRFEHLIESCKIPFVLGAIAIVYAGVQVARGVQRAGERNRQRANLNQQRIQPPQEQEEAA